MDALDLDCLRVSDGSLLFLMHLLSKCRDVQDGGSRVGIILNGSPSVYRWRGERVKARFAAM